MNLQDGSQTINKIISQAYTGVNHGYLFYNVSLKEFPLLRSSECLSMNRLLHIHGWYFSNFILASTQWQNPVSYYNGIH